MFYICSLGDSFTSVISVSGGVAVFAEYFGSGTGVIKNILFTANLIVFGGLAAYYTFQGVLWMTARFLKAGVLVLVSFLSIRLFVGFHFQGRLGISKVSRDN